MAGNAFFVDSALHSVGDSFLEASDGHHFYDAATSDKANSSLTRAFDLSGLSSAWLEFQLWRKLEDDYEHGYATVSADDGDSLDGACSGVSP